MKKNKFKEWLYNEYDVFEGFDNVVKEPDLTYSKIKNKKTHLQRYLEAHQIKKFEKVEYSWFKKLYRFFAVFCCMCLIATLLLAVSDMPQFGVRDPNKAEVADRYTEQGMVETGAVNTVAGMILDYRAFDTLGESFVLFTALNCVLILLRRDKKYTPDVVSDYDLTRDPILHTGTSLLVPCVIIYGIYILLNGHLSPGGGFSGGAILGAGFILFSIAYGFKTVDRFMSAKFFSVTSCISLLFYCLSKSYSFFVGANHLDSIVSTGNPGDIISAGLILPLNIAVGLVVTCTMYSFYSLFSKGEI